MKKQHSRCRKKRSSELPAEEHKSLTARTRQPHSLVQFFAESPLANLEIKLERARDCVQKARS
jgi:hypothetical protein